MFSAKPILGILNKNSDTAIAIIESGAGWVVEPDDFSEIAQKFNEILLLPNSKLIDIGLLGREYALAHFTKKANLPELAYHILK